MIARDCKTYKRANIVYALNLQASGLVSRSIPVHPFLVIQPLIGRRHIRPAWCDSPGPTLQDASVGLSLITSERPSSRLNHDDNGTRSSNCESLVDQSCSKRFDTGFILLNLVYIALLTRPIIGPRHLAQLLDTRDLRPGFVDCIGFSHSAPTFPPLLPFTIHPSR